MGVIVMLVILTLVGITLFIVVGCILLSNLMDKNKQQSEKNNGEESNDNQIGYFVNWWKYAIVALILLFIIDAWFNSIDSKPPLQDDWNYDGKVDDEDLDTYIKWKEKQSE